MSLKRWLDKICNFLYRGPKASSVDLDHFRHFISYDTTVHKLYVKDILTGLQGDFKDIESRSIKDVATAAGHKRGEIIEWYNDRKWHFSEVYPRIVRTSFFVSVYSHFEKNLGNIADFVAEELPRFKKRSMCKGKGIEQTQNYLKKIQGYRNFPDNGTEWLTLKKVRDVRNLLVHNEGQISTCKHKSWIDGFTKYHSNWLEFPSIDRISPTQDGCLGLIETVDMFLKKLLDVIDPNHEKRLSDLLEPIP